MVRSGAWCWCWWCGFLPFRCNNATQLSSPYAPTTVPMIPGIAGVGLALASSPIPMVPGVLRLSTAPPSLSSLACWLAGWLVVASVGYICLSLLVIYSLCFFCRVYVILVDLVGCREERKGHPSRSSRPCALKLPESGTGWLGRSVGWFSWLVGCSVLGRWFMECRENR